MPRNRAWDYLTIEPSRGETYNHPGEFTVYGPGTYERGSVLEGRPMRVYVEGGFTSVETAKAKYPEADESGSTHIPVSVMTRHLPDDDGSSSEADDYRNE